MSLSRLRSLSLVVAAVIALSYICFVLRTSATVSAIVLLLAALLAGLFTRLAEATTASITATLCLDYFFVPPIQRISVADPEDWLILGVFLAVCLLATNLSARLRNQHDDLIAQNEEKEKLYALSRALLRIDDENARRLIVNECMALFGFTEAALFESASGSVQHSHSPGLITDDMLKHVAVCGSVDHRPELGITVAPISLGNKAFGSLGFVGPSLPETTLQAIVGTVAVALAQAQAQEAASHADAVRQSEELKSIMIDALAHDLKTPLTILEAATDMLLPDAGVTPAQQHDLVHIVKQEAKGLRRMIEEAIHLARIDATKLKLEYESVKVADLVSSSLESLADRVRAREIILQLPSGLPAVSVDRELFVQVLKQVLDNAMKYSPLRAPITISAAENACLVSISICDAGPGLTEIEQSKIFDKFYRGRHDRSSVQGTGMGLAIAREIVEAHGGSITVESQIGKGSCFTISLHAADRPVQV